MTIPIPVPSPSELWEYIKKIADWIKKTQHERLVEIQLEARCDPGLYDYLAYLYSEYETLTYESRPFPIAIFRVPKSQRYDLESVLGKLDIDADDAIDNKFDQVGQSY